MSVKKNEKKKHRDSLKQTVTNPPSLHVPVGQFEHPPPTPLNSPDEHPLVLDVPLSSDPPVADGDAG